jgi:hypothetical protein
MFSALPLIATDARTSSIGSFVPNPDVTLPLFDHLVGATISGTAHAGHPQ